MLLVMLQGAVAMRGLIAEAGCCVHVMVPQKCISHLAPRQT